MPRHLLIHGLPATGKTHRCLAAIEAVLQENPLPNILLLVPSHRSGRAYTYELHRRFKGRGMAGIAVGTFDQWAGKQAPWCDPLVDIEKQALLRDLMVGIEEEPYRSLQGDRGLAQAVGNLISELKQAQVTPERLKAVDFDPPSARIAGFQKLFERYNTQLCSAQRRDREDLLLLAIDLFKERAAEGKVYDLVVCDGFEDLTFLQMEALQAVMSAAESSIVTVTWRQKAGTLFYRPGQVMEGLFAPFGERLESVASDAENAPESLAKSLGECWIDPGPKPENSLFPVTLHKAATREDEAREACRVIRNLLEEGFAPGEIAVIARRPKEYEPWLASWAAGTGIPLGLTRERPLLDVPPVNYLAARWKLACAESTEEAVFRVLEAHPGVSLAALASFRARAVDPAFPATWEGWQELAKGTPIHRILEEERRLSNLEAPFWETLLLEVQRVRGLAHTQGKTALGEEALNHLQEAIKRLEKLETGGVIAFLAEESRFTSGLPRLLDLLALETLMESPPEGERIPVLSPLEARGESYRCVLLLGVSAGQFPASTFQDAILRDTERRFMDVGLRTRTARQREEEFLFYLAITRASERLMVSSAAQDEKGSAGRPSLLVDHFKRCFPVEETFPGATTNLSKAPNFLGLRDLRNKVLPILLRDRKTVMEGVGGDGNSEDALAVTAAHRWGRKISPPLTPLLDASRSYTAACRLAAENAPFFVLERFTPEHRFSPSEMNLYLDCPLKFFAEKVLRLEAPSEGYDARARGELYHWAFSQLVNTAAERSLEFSAETLPALRDVVREVVEQALKKPPLSQLPAPRRRMEGVRLEKTLDRFAEWEGAWRATGEFRPWALEVSFGMERTEDASPRSVSDPLVIGGSEGAVAFRGRIDRMDLNPNTRQVFVIDYKSGKPPAKKDIQEVKVSQLPVYLLAAQHLWGFDPVGGEYVSPGKDQRSGLRLEGIPAFKAGSRDKALTPGEWGEWLEASAVGLRQTVSNIRRGNIRQNPREGFKTCQWCSFQDGCYYWRRGSESEPAA